MARTATVEVEVEVEVDGDRRTTTARLRELAGRVAPTVLATEERLAVRADLVPLLPGGGLRRGSVVQVTGSTSMLLALLAGPSAGGSWTAVVGMPALGAEAAAEAGIDLSRLALVPSPGERWSTVVAALLDALDVVVVGPVRARSAEARKLATRARERRAVLVVSGNRWPEAPDVTLSVTGGQWSGLGGGWGRLTERRLEVVSGGRGAASRPRRATLVSAS